MEIKCENQFCQSRFFDGTCSIIKDKKNIDAGAFIENCDLNKKYNNVILERNKIAKDFNYLLSKFKRLSNTYQIDILMFESERIFGLSFQEALEKCYENIQKEMVETIYGMSFVNEILDNKEKIYDKNYC